MEEKERKQLKKRLLGLVINEPPYPYPITMAEVMVNDMSKPNLKPLLNFIEKELDKAREEGRREYARELLDDYYQPDSDSIEIDVSEIQSELSKLTTK